MAPRPVRRVESVYYEKKRFSFHCRRVVCAVLFRLFGTVGLFNKLYKRKKEKNRPETAGGAIPAQVTYTLCTTYTTRHPCFAAGNRTSRPFNTLFDLQPLECRNSSTHNHIKSHLHDVNHPRVRWPRSGLNALCGATHEGGRCGRHRRGTMRPCNCARRAARVAKRRCERLTRTPTLTTDPSL